MVASTHPPTGRSDRLDAVREVLRAFALRHLGSSGQADPTPAAKRALQGLLRQPKKRAPRPRWRVDESKQGAAVLDFCTLPREAIIVRHGVGGFSVGVHESVSSKDQSGLQSDPSHVDEVRATPRAVRACLESWLESGVIAIEGGRFAYVDPSVRTVTPPAASASDLDLDRAPIAPVGEHMLELGFPGTEPSSPPQAPSPRTPSPPRGHTRAQPPVHDLSDEVPGYTEARAALDGLAERRVAESLAAAAALSSTEPARALRELQLLHGELASNPSGAGQRLAGTSRPVWFRVLMGQVGCLMALGRPQAALGILDDPFFTDEERWFALLDEVGPHSALDYHQASGEAWAALGNLERADASFTAALVIAARLGAKAQAHAMWSTLLRALWRNRDMHRLAERADQAAAYGDNLGASDVWLLGRVYRCYALYGLGELDHARQLGERLDSTVLTELPAFERGDWNAFMGELFERAG